MSGGDAIGINGLFSNESPQAPQYADKQWIYINDTNNGVGLNNQVMWQTTILKGQLINYFEGFLILPFSVQGGTATTEATGGYTALTPLAFRQSTLDIAAQFQVLSDQGQVLSNELTTQLGNNLLMAIENGVVWEVNNADERDFAVDRWINGYFSDNKSSKSAQPGPLQTFATPYNLTTGCNTNDLKKYKPFTTPNPMTNFIAATSGGATTTAFPTISAIEGDNLNYNQGFQSRVLFLRNQGLQQTGADGQGVISGYAVIHLADICDFFRQCRTPVINLGLQIQMWFNQPSGQSSFTYPTFMTGINPGGSSNNFLWAPPQVTWGSSVAQPTQSYGSTGCRLVVPSIKMGPDDTQRFSSLLQSGLTKSFRYIQKLTYVRTNENLASNQFTFTVPGLPVHPVRVWLGIFQAGIVQDQRGCQALCPTVAVSNLNIQVNNLPYFRYPLNTSMDQWNQLKEQMNPITGSLYRWSDWVNVNRWNVLDISRLGDRLPSATEPVSLVVTGQTVSATQPGNVDIVVIVETLTQVLFNFSNSGTTVVVGNLD